MKPAIVFLASAWGSRHGGINSFNADLATAAARAVANRTMQVICVTAEPVTEHEVRKASRLDIRILTAPVRNPEQWLAEDSVAILLALARVGRTHKVLWWIGHDAVTGEAAVALAEQAGGLSAVIHHTSYGDYAGYKHGTSTTARAKRAHQRRLFVATDRRLAVGPLLQGRVAEMAGVPVQDVVALIPGLAEVTALPQRSQGLNAIIFGRLDSANDRIKQARLAVSAFASALRLAPPALREAAKLTVIGVTEAEERMLKRLTLPRAGRVVNLIAVPFLEDRDALLRELREANLALASSWHEGFGLTAWEAVAAGVPLIVGRNSGVYRFLNDVVPGGATSFVHAVDVRGALSRRTGGHFRREDEHEVRVAILDIAGDLARVQERARLLRSLLLRYTWARTAEQLARALGLQRYTRRLLDFDASAQPPATRHMHPLLASRDLGYESVAAAGVFLTESRVFYGQGDYETAYKNSIRAANLFEHYTFYTDAVAALIEAMSALRPTRQSRRMRKVILKIECLCSKHAIGINVRWLFLDRLALVLFDYATSASGFSKAAWVMEASEKIFRRISVDALNPQQLRFDSANSLRRRALIKGSAGLLGSHGRIQYVLDELHEHSQQFSRDRQFSSVVTNLDVASKLAADVLHDREGAHNYSQQALQYRSDIGHWWALQEHLWREAEHYKATGDKDRTFETVVDALKIYERSPVVLEPVPGDKGIGRGDLGVMVKQLGIDRLALAEVGINLKPLTLTPLGLSDAMIDRVVSAVMR